MDKKRNPTGLFLTLLLVSLIFFAFDRLGLLMGIRALTEGGISRVSVGLRDIEVVPSQQEKDTADELLVEINKLKRENEDLRLQLGVAAGPVSDLEKSPTWREGLWSGGGVSDNSTNRHLLPASVLATKRFFVIDKGSEDGVYQEQSVVFKNIYVGKIATVSSKTSRVLLPIESESSLSVGSTKTSAKGIVRGVGKEMILSQVLLSEQLKEGDTLLTIGDLDEEGRGIRGGLIVGTITNIRKSHDQLYQEATVVPLLDFEKLKNVFIVL